MRNEAISFMIFISLILLVILAPSVSAKKGVGIMWSTETEILPENSEHCIEYGIYNPWDEDVRITLGVSGELQKVISKLESDVKLIPANTSSKNPIPTKLCFKIPKVYEEDCLVGGLLCEQRCDQNMVTYTGEVVVNEVPSGGGGMGSATALGVGTDLTLKVRCVKHPMDWTPVYILAIVIATLMLLAVYKKRK